jgi:hypothetical protein
VDDPKSFAWFIDDMVMALSFTIFDQIKVNKSLPAKSAGN